MSILSKLCAIATPSPPAAATQEPRLAPTLQHLEPQKVRDGCLALAWELGRLRQRIEANADDQRSLWLAWRQARGSGQDAELLQQDYAVARDCGLMLQQQHHETSVRLLLWRNIAARQASHARSRTQARLSDGIDLAALRDAVTQGVAETEREMQDIHDILGIFATAAERAENERRAWHDEVRRRMNEDDASDQTANNTGAAGENKS